MRHRMKVLVQTPAGTTEITLPLGTTSIGGSQEDPLRIEGLDAKVVVITLTAHFALISSQIPIRMGTVYYPKLNERLWLTGETLTVCEALSLTRVETTTLFHEGVVLQWLSDKHASPYHPTLMTAASALVGVMGTASASFCWLGPRTRVGRSASNDFQIDDSSIAREHFSLVAQRNRYFIDVEPDAPSVLLNGGRVRRPTVVQHLDSIQVGTSELRAFLGVGPRPTQV